jgi:endo-1,3-1,4-beta-glycanase ExoK
MASTQTGAPRCFKLVTAMFSLAVLPAVAADVVPAWRATFGALDPVQWETQLYTFPANGCNMTADSVTTVAGQLALSVNMNSAPSQARPKGCNAGEVGSRRFFTHGLFTVRMAAPAVPGGVSAFFLMNQWRPDNWEHKEIDIEFLGRDATALQLTTHDFQNGGRDWKSAATTVKLKFDYSAAAHDYAILWTPRFVRWYVDGRLLHEETKYVPNEPLQIRMNIYLGDLVEPGIVDWLGARDLRKLPAQAQFGTIDYYPLNALPNGYGAN